VGDQQGHAEKRQLGEGFYRAEVVVNCGIEFSIREETPQFVAQTLMNRDYDRVTQDGLPSQARNGVEELPDVGAVTSRCLGVYP
jgi:hypothetical protein